MQGSSRPSSPRGSSSARGRPPARAGPLFRLETAFIEALHSNRSGRKPHEHTAAFARFCLAMLRDVAELAGAAEPLLLRLREAFVELIFSAEPYDGASLELRVPWFEVASRRASEKFALKTKEDQLLADLQHLREELEKAQGTASNAVRERARMASVCREREEEAKRSTSTLQVVEKNQLETTRATAVVVASLERRCAAPHCASDLGHEQNGVLCTRLPLPQAGIHMRGADGAQGAMQRV